MAWGMRGSKDSNKTDENDESAHWLWQKLQKIPDCNHGIVHKKGPKTPTKMTKTTILTKTTKNHEVKWDEGCRGQVLQRRHRKERFWRKLPKIVKCNDMKDNRDDFTAKRMKMIKTTICARICLVGWQDPGSLLKMTIWTKMTRNYRRVEWDEIREG